MKPFLQFILFWLSLVCFPAFAQEQQVVPYTLADRDRVPSGLKPEWRRWKLKLVRLKQKLIPNLALLKPRWILNLKR